MLYTGGENDLQSILIDNTCLLYTSDAADEGLGVDLGGRRIIKKIVGPVSYTHLRAHETCADLVCRLLLEKKH
ncbi:hypothetical protein JMUB7529_27880 [Staphylococcus aureus]